MNRSNRTEPPQKPTLKLVGDGKDKSGDALSPFGLLNQGSTISPRTGKEAQLSELLKSLENKVETLESRYLEVLDTLISVMERLVKVGAFTNAITITDVVE